MLKLIMNLKQMKTTALVVIIAALSMVACGDGDDAGGSGGVGESCSPGEFVLTGTVGTSDLDLVESTNSYYLMNFSSPEFGGASEEGSNVGLTWGESIPDNQVTSGEGSVSLSSEVEGVEEICAKSAELVIVGSSVQFELSDLVDGDCDSGSAIEGTISGCVAKQGD